MALSPTRVRKSMISYRVLLFALIRQELLSTRSGTTLLKINFRNIIVELHSNGIVVWCLRSFSCLRTKVHVYEVLLFLCTQARGHRHGTHDQMMYLIFVFLDQISDKVQFWNSRSDFWQSAIWKFLKFFRFCMEMFIFSEFDLERKTTKSTTIVYISLDFLLWLTYELPFAAIEQTPHRIDLFW